ncbi:hypothetical protein H6P81_001986 [Aristolochia fimbriata]|uniref:Secreted protein n=1 Tax=Aristolochia fimbriata TaxID=158543 RepID=A0AAV7F8Q6_ARIFI|nr:hypothetical protein H6P81_001986 [Aristolochia fimbriata]
MMNLILWWLPPPLLLPSRPARARMHTRTTTIPLTPSILPSFPPSLLPSFHHHRATAGAIAVPKPSCWNLKLSHAFSQTLCGCCPGNLLGLETEFPNSPTRWAQAVAFVPNFAPHDAAGYAPLITSQSPQQLAGGTPLPTSPRYTPIRFSSHFRPVGARPCALPSRQHRPHLTPACPSLFLPPPYADLMA